MDMYTFCDPAAVGDGPRFYAPDMDTGKCPGVSRFAFPDWLHRSAVRLATEWAEDCDCRLAAGRLDPAAAQAEYVAFLGNVKAKSVQRYATEREAYLRREIAPVYLDTIRERLPNPAAFDSVMRWTPEEPCGLVAGGPTGRGKSRSMFALLARLHRECGTLFRAVRAVDLKARVLELARSDSAELAVYVEGLRAVPVLFVDDLAQAAMSAVYGEKLFDLVEHRTVRGLPCLFTVQIGPTDLERKLAGYEGLHADRAACLVRRIREFCRSVDFGA